MAFCGRALDLLVDVDGDCEDDGYESENSDQEATSPEDETSDLPSTPIKKPRFIVTPPTTASNECSICLDDTELIDLSCKHRFCNVCVVHYLTTKINESDVPYRHQVTSVTRDDQALVLEVNTHVGINCPHLQCRGVIQYLEVKSFVDEVTYSKFDRSVLHETLYGMPDIKPCPFGCGNFLQEDCLCGTELCRKKEMARRELEAKHKERMDRQNDNKLCRWAKQGGVRCCPKCYNHIEKNGGCNHMCCSRCHTNFNWTEAPSFSFQAWNPAFVASRLQNIK